MLFRSVTDIEKDIADLKRRIAAQADRVPGSETTELNPARRDLLEKVYTSEVSLARLAIKEQALAQVISETKKRLREIARRSVDSEQLAREVKANEEAYLLYRKKVEEARISEAMDQNKFMNVSIAETAYPPMTPIGPRKDLSLLFAVMVGLVAGVGGAFFREFFDHSIKSEEEMKSTVALPLLASIPEENGGKKNGKNGGR